MSPLSLSSKTYTHRTRIIAAYAILLVNILCETAQTDEPPTKAKSFRDRVVDRVTLKDGSQLLGVGISEKPAQLLLRTAWIKSSDDKFYNDQLKPLLETSNQTARSAVASKLQKEIDHLRQTIPNDQQRIGLLEEIHDQLVQVDENDPDFIIVEIPKSRLRKIDAQPTARRELCRLAMLNKIPDVEELHWKSVTAQLQAIPESQRRRAATAKPTDDTLDADRILSAVDVRLNTATRLVKSGDQFFDETSKPDMSAIINSMLGGNVQKVLGELLNEGASPAAQRTLSDSLPDAAGNLADAKNQRTVAISGFDFDIAEGSAIVTRQLFRKTDDGKWTLLLSSEGKSTAAELKPGQVDAIQDDPQIKQITEIVQGLGLGDGQLSNALQMGAVVQNAMSQSSNAFENNLQEIVATRGLSQSVTMPTLVLPEAPPGKAAP